LAEQFHVLGNEGWNLANSEQEKRQLIKDAIKLHKLKGTKAGVERALSTLNIEGKVSEWFEYGGDPFHFKIDIFLQNYAYNEKVFENLKKMIEEYKNVRSVLEEISVVLNVNSPMETPAANSGDILNYTVTNTITNTDEMLSDNTFVLNQTVVNSYDPNDKTCLQGNYVGPDKIGQYVHYMIRFENTGTFPAENIVVKDMIDTAKFDVSSLIPLNASHNYVTRINGNKVEFIFENINLPFDDATNDGYVAFKIKTLPSLVVGNTFSNTANIYFDYNFPIITNTATTTIAALNNPSFEFATYFSLYPNPATSELIILMMIV
jgi:P2-related tail formation protein